MELTPAPFHFSSVQKFSHRRGAQIKKLILRKLIGVPNNIGDGVDILDLLAAILDFAVCAAMQTVSKCSQC